MATRVITPIRMTMKLLFICLKIVQKKYVDSLKNISTKLQSEWMINSIQYYYRDNLQICQTE